MRSATSWFSTVTPAQTCSGQGSFGASSAKRSARLGQNLVVVLIGQDHDLEYLFYKRYRHILMEKVAHGVDEDHLVLFPAHGRTQHVRLEGDLEPMGIIGVTHGL